jgi:hypothetical protein
MRPLWISEATGSGKHGGLYESDVQQKRDAVRKLDSVIRKQRPKQSA